jgi:hypothetical protein
MICSFSLYAGCRGNLRKYLVIYGIFILTVGFFRGKKGEHAFVDDEDKPFVRIRGVEKGFVYRSGHGCFPFSPMYPLEGAWVFVV